MPLHTFYQHAFTQCSTQRLAGFANLIDVDRGAWASGALRSHRALQALHTLCLTPPPPPPPPPQLPQLKRSACNERRCAQLLDHTFCAVFGALCFRPIRSSYRTKPSKCPVVELWGI